MVLRVVVTSEGGLCGRVARSKKARRLRHLQQAVQEEVARYGLDKGEFEEIPTSPRAPSTRVTPRPSPLKRSEAASSTYQSDRDQVSEYICCGSAN